MARVAGLASMCAGTGRRPGCIEEHAAEPGTTGRGATSGNRSMQNSAHKAAQRVVYLDEVDASDRRASVSPRVDGLRPYILEVVGQLAQIARDNGDAALANE